MISNPFYQSTNKRQRLTRSDTAPSINVSNIHTANQLANTDVSNVVVAQLVTNDYTSSSCSQCEIREQKYLTRKQRGGCSPPSNIKYRIRHKSAASNYRRKLSETGFIVSDTAIPKRSQSVDPNRKLSTSTLKKPMSEATISKLSRSLSKRMPRSGSAKNLMDLHDDISYDWTDGKVMQKDLSPLFCAIESNDVNRVEALLTADQKIVNTTNKQELTPLDVAMLYNHPTVAKRLIQFEGRNNECYDKEPRLLYSHLTLLSKDIANKLSECCDHPYNSSGSIYRDVDNLKALKEQIKLFKTNFEQMKPGSMPRKVILEVAGLYSLLVTVYPPSDNIVTRYLIELSRHSDFSDIDDHITVRTIFPVGVYEICDLDPHETYFVRVSSGNLRGVGPSQASVPASAAPSCWTESMTTEQMSVGIRRCPHPQEWCQVSFSDLETRMEHQLQFWLASIKCRSTNNAYNSSVTMDPDQKRHLGRKSLLKALVASTSKFVRQPKHGLYVALVYKALDSDKYLTCGEDQLPFISVDDDHPSLAAINAECIWLMRLLSNKPNLKLLVNVLGRLQLPASVQLRVKLIIATCQLQMTFENYDLGLLYPCVIQDTNYSVIVLTKQIPVAKQLILPTGLKWSLLSKISKVNSNLNDSLSSQSGLEEELYGKIETFISFYRRNQASLDDGLYLGYVRFKSTLDQLYIQQNISKPTMFPVVKIRDNWHVDKVEWDHILSLRFPDMVDPKTSKGSKLQSSIVKTWQKLQTDLKLKAPNVESCRVYTEEILWLKKRLSVILIVPSIDDFCGLPGREISLPLDYEWVSLHAFEYYHFNSNLHSDNQFSTWASLNSGVEVLLPIAQHCLRQGFDKNEIDQCKDRLEQFQSIQNNLEQYWKNIRWSVDVISNCRDKHSSSTLTIPIQTLIDTDPLSQTVLYTDIHCPDTIKVKGRKNHSFDDTHTLSQFNYPFLPGSSSPAVTVSSINGSLLYDSGIASNTSTLDTHTDTDFSQSNQKKVRGQIRVYADYPCGLIEGTSLKLLLTSKTTSADIIKLIVYQLNETSKERNPHAPRYSPTELRNFYLSVTIDSITMPLPSDFHPLLLKPPWKRGKISIRLRSQ